MAGAGDGRRRALAGKQLTSPTRKAGLSFAHGQYLESFLPIDSETNHVWLVDPCASPAHGDPISRPCLPLQGPEKLSPTAPLRRGFLVAIR